MIHTLFLYFANRNYKLKVVEMKIKVVKKTFIKKFFETN